MSVPYALLAAIRSGKRPKVEVALAEVEDRAAHEPVIAAIDAARPDLLELVLAAGFSPESRAGDKNPALVLVCLRADQPRATELAAALVAHGPPELAGRPDRAGWSPVHYAAQAGNAALVEVLLRGGAPASPAHRKYLQTPLHLTRAPAVVAALIAGGADVNARLRDGKTPLVTLAMGTVGAGELAATDALLAAGADPDAVDEHGDDALRIAARVGAWPLARRLAEVTRDLDRADSMGAPPLLVALGHKGPGSLGVAQELVARGADPRVVDHRGRGAVDAASSRPPSRDRDAALAWLAELGVTGG